MSFKERNRNMKRVKLGMALALLLGALVLAGCGGGSSSSSTSEPSSTASSSGSEGSGSESSESEASGPEGKPGGFNISEEAKACLKEKGLELPGFKGGEGGPPGGGERPEGGPPGGGKGFGGEHSEEMKQAFQECGVEFGGFKGGPGGEGGKPNVNSAAFKKQIEEYAACVRENGYEIAEPNFSGEGPVFEKSESESAAFKKASASCETLLKGGSQESSG
jgi:hypothetical protein